MKTQLENRPQLPISGSFICMIFLVLHYYLLKSVYLVVVRRSRSARTSEAVCGLGASQDTSSIGAAHICKLSQKSSTNCSTEVKISLFI
jgi:hypothetical protein